MSRGRRYEQEPKLNLKKVFAVIIALVVVIMFIFVIRNILTKGKETGKISSETYFVVYKDNKWGVINSSGNIVIDPSYEEMIIIPNNKKDVFLCTYDVNYETGEYKTKALNSKNEEIYKDFEQIEAIANSNDSNIIWYEENVLKVKKDGKYGLLNQQGKEILKTEYEDIQALKGIKNSLKVKKDGKYGIVNDEGKTIVNTEYIDISILGKDDKSGYIVKGENEKYGIIDYSQNQILEQKYDRITNIYGNDLYVVEQDGKQKLISKDGTEVLTQGFDEIKSILKSTEDGVIYTKNGKYGVIKNNGEIVIDPEFEDLKEAKQGILIAKKDGKYGIIDLQKNIKVEYTYTSIQYNQSANLYIAEDENYNANILNDNYEIKITGILNEINNEKGYIKIRVGEQNKYYNFRFEEKNVKDILTSNTLYLDKKDGKYGFIDKNGNVVVEYIYDDAIEQNSCGFAAIKKDGKWGSIDSKGNVVIEPTYNLDDYIVIDFIGKWHLGQDLNLNYYNVK